MAAQFLVDNRYIVSNTINSGYYFYPFSHLAFLMSDEAGNICLFNYMPETQESNGGERLILRGILNVGTNVNAWLRVKGDLHSTLYFANMIE